MEESHFFALLQRMKYIQRWSLMRNTEVENLQGHSLETAMIAHQLGVLRNTYFDGAVDVNRLAVLAMYHDVSEVFTGDMPTPVKYFNPKLRALYGEVEQLANETLWHTLPEEVQPCYEEALLGISDEYAVLIKAADTMSAFMKCVTEKAAGNDEFNAAYDSIYKRLQDMNLPEVNLFLKVYVPSLTKSLDEMNVSFAK
ncbi:5'-deoxynucleotidase [Veillonella sp. oral taxon 780]|uniref:5'-deoxynucleotidase n=1 Tax=Veillonella sp. oral taxon 780 TaxID=671229 RepID=UPI00021A2350|nr:5'-deoxynucleotidase [Veillonella sp. oral taxon 780]EGS39946.1 HD domain protein [Veillonella sp. oral taxon 780 str. F0422]